MRPPTSTRLGRPKNPALKTQVYANPLSPLPLFGFWGRGGRPDPQNRRLPAGPKIMYHKHKRRGLQGGVCGERGAEVFVCHLFFWETWGNKAKKPHVFQQRMVCGPCQQKAARLTNHSFLETCVVCGSWHLGRSTTHGHLHRSILSPMTVQALRNEPGPLGSCRSGVASRRWRHRAHHPSG